jgi:hypothetical protein
MQRLIVVIALVISASSTANAQQAPGTEAGGYEVIANAFGFGIDIPGCPDASKNIRDILMDDLRIDVLELPPLAELEHRQFRPGEAHVGRIRVRFPHLENDPCLREWADSVKVGKGMRKNITVTLFKSDKTPGRSYFFFDTLPIALSTDTEDQGIEELTLQVGGVGFDGGSAQSPRDAASLNGFVVQALAGKDATTVIDVAWESCTGGAQTIELHPASFGALADTKRSCTEVTLRGPMTTSRGWLAGMLNDVARGVDSRVMLRCGNEKGGRGYLYIDAFPVAYVFPKMSVTNTTGNVMEEVALKPIRCELK